jgi:hypothetical protein
MDTLTTLATAGTLLQLVDFALKILTTGHQLYTGSLSTHEELKCVARDLSGLANRSARDQGVSETTQKDPALEDLRKKSETIAQELMEHLGILKAQGKKGPLKGFRPALKGTWSQKDLDTLIQKLQWLRKAIESWLLDIR